MMMQLTRGDVRLMRGESVNARARVAALIAVITLVSLFACASPAPRAPVAVPLGVDTIWYASARARQDGHDTQRLTDILELGLVLFTRDRGGRTLIDSVLVDSATFVRSLGAAVGDDAPALLYVHGYGTSLREAWVHTQNVRANARTRAPWIAFAWPSNGSGLAWPRRGAMLDRAYREDSARAAASRPAFARVMQILGAAVPNDRLVVVAHSMGGQLVGEALATDTALRADLARVPLRAVAFVVPDVDALRFADAIVPAAQQTARRVVLYASARDRLLALATFLGHEARAGHVGDSALVRPGLETVDATHADFREGWAQRMFGLHHAMKRAVGTTFDIAHIVARGLPAECRASLGIGERDSRGVWRLNRGEPGRRGSEAAVATKGNDVCAPSVVRDTSR
ncbi:MAG: alpha/beta fold hydrolase [Gemmatimonadaceae bacterium]